MLVFLTLQSCADWAAQSATSGIYATIGNFDGVHLGHQSLVRETVMQAKKAKHATLLITFEPHPLRVLGKESEIPLALNTTAQRLELVAELGVEAVLLLPFTPDFAKLTAQDFLDGVLTPLNVHALFIGHDFRMGSDQADAEKLTLSGAAQKHNMDVRQVEAVLSHDTPVSSTRIRQALLHGNVEIASALLGRPHAVRGAVVHGEGRGGPLLGFPTANMVVENVMMPKPAAYATSARLVCAEPNFCKHDVWQWDGREWADFSCSCTLSEPFAPSISFTEYAQSYASITSFGRNPTFAGKRLTLETFIIDFSADIYDRMLEISFLQTLREEKKFSSPQDLIAQLHSDVKMRQSLPDELWKVSF